ncbi:MAG: hypothetical protein RLZZ244_387 [Verrucomicrobiota bacterium]|jgi:mannose-6-phosphate isomerase
MPFHEPLTFTPIYQPRIWGGRALAHRLGRTLPEGEPIGESWDLVDRPEAQSVIDSGPHAGTSLHALWTHHRTSVFGTGLPDTLRFPILFKILDAAALLSVQVHPPEPQARRFGGEPKTEAWYFLNAQPDACVYLGFRKGVTQRQFESILDSGQIEPLLHRLAVHTGDAIYVPSGRCHAIGAGCLIAEIQQNSDTTYRVFDWNRLGLDGQPRALHRKESLECIDFLDHEPGPLPRTAETLVECPHFALEVWNLEEPQSQPSNTFAFHLVVEGTLECGGRRFSKGSTFLLPAESRHLPLHPIGEGCRVLRAIAPR